MNRDDGFNAAGTDSVLGLLLLFTLLIGISVDSLLSAGNGADVLDGVARERPRGLNLGSVRNGRCVDVT